MVTPTADIAPAVPLRVVRVARGFSQAGLADHCAIARRTVSRTEKGHTRPTPETMAKIATALDWPAEDLFPNDDGRPAEAAEVTTTGGRARDVKR